MGMKKASQKVMKFGEYMELDEAFIYLVQRASFTAKKSASFKGGRTPEVKTPPLTPTLN